MGEFGLGKIPEDRIPCGFQGYERLITAHHFMGNILTLKWARIHSHSYPRIRSSEPCAYGIIVIVPLVFASEYRSHDVPPKSEKLSPGVTGHPSEVKPLSHPPLFLKNPAPQKNIDPYESIPTLHGNIV